jgi:hypothetical protein
LLAAKLKEKADIRADDLPLSELDWLEETFSRHNEFHNYPLKIAHVQGQEGTNSVILPRFEGTTRCWLLAEVQGLGKDLLACELAPLIPQGETLILVDQAKLETNAIAGRHALPFLERAGEYWGPPPDDETAIREFERLRGSGANFIVFAWPAFWWLDYYQGFNRHLRQHHRNVLENDRIVVFDLRT